MVQRYEQRGSGETALAHGAWEEYRYDALGRRVMTRVRRPNGGAPTGTNALCTSLVSGVCSSYYERTWWAGDQILAEWRTADGTPNPTNSGSVGYVHAPGVKGIDAPVAVITTGSASAGARVITEDWRGLGESSLFPNGAPADNTLYGGTAITVAWPSGRGAYFTPYLGQPSGSSVESTWLGSLVENGAGAAGLLYRRNRYYDPASGRFTQQDPIGLAGGMNVYGFAGGDPVTYSDPFGLCPGISGTNQNSVDDCPDESSRGLWDRFWNGPRYVEVDGVRRPVESGVVPTWISGPGAAVRGGAAAVRGGQAGEAAVHAVADIGSKVAIRVGGRVRIPDGLTGQVLTEVKNVRHLSYTRQLRDFAQYAQANGLRFDLWVRSSTNISGPLQDAVRSGVINLRVIP